MKFRLLIRFKTLHLYKKTCRCQREPNKKPRFHRAGGGSFSCFQETFPPTAANFLARKNPS
jgi:hypothetical protein